MTETTGLPSDDELLKQLEEELKTLKVSDLLVQTLCTAGSPSRTAISTRPASPSKPFARSCPCSKDLRVRSSCGTSNR